MDEYEEGKALYAMWQYSSDNYHHHLTHYGRGSQPSLSAWKQANDKALDKVLHNPVARECYERAGEQFTKNVQEALDNVSMMFWEVW